MRNQQTKPASTSSPWYGRWRVAMAAAVLSMLAACGGGGGGSAGPDPIGKTAPTQVALVEVSSAGSSSIDVSWLPAVDSVTPASQIKYEVHASTEAIYVPGSSTLKAEGIGILSARLNDLQADTRYTIMLVAINSAGLSAIGSPLTVTTSAINSETTLGVVVATPTDQQLAAVTDSQITLTADATVPKVGQFIASAQGDGFLRQVTQVTTVNGQTLVQTQPASLNQVVDNLEISSAFNMINVPTEVAPTQAGIVVRSLPGRQSATEWQWPQTNFRLSSNPVTRNVVNAQGSLQVGVVNAAGNLDVSSQTESKVGNWATFSGPNTIGILTGTSGAVDLNLMVTNDSIARRLFGDNERVPTAICKVQVIDSGANGLAVISKLTPTETEMVDGYTAIRRATQLLAIDASNVPARAEPYTVVLRAYIDEAHNNCKDRPLAEFFGWKEKLDIAISVVVVSTPNFPQHESKPLEFSGDFKVKNEITFTFDPRFQADVKVKKSGFSIPKPTYARLEAKARAELAQKLTITATGTGTIDQTKALIDARKFVKIYMAGTVPIVMSGEFSADLRIQGHVTGAITATEEIKFSLEDMTYGVIYDAAASPQWRTTKNVRPTYSLKVAGSGDASAQLTLSLLPKLSIQFYEAATGRLIVSPYLQADAGVHGQVLADTSPAGTTTDADYWLTQGKLSGGVDAYLMADLSILDRTFLIWPANANINDYTSFEKVPLLQNSPVLIAGLPSLSAALDVDTKHPSDSRAFLIKGSAVDVTNPFKSLFGGPDAFLPFANWTQPRVIALNNAGYSFVPSPDDGNPGDVWIAFTAAGSYTVRLGGNSSMGGWARQVAEVVVVVADGNNNGIVDLWEKKYGLTGSGAAIAAADPDADGLTNLQEFLQGSHPLIANTTVPIGAPSQTAVITSVIDDVAPNTGLVANGGSTDDTTPTLSGTLSAMLTASQVLRVYDSTTLLGVATVTGQSWAYTPSVQQAGTRSYRVVVSRADGVEGVASSVWSIVISGAAAVPSVSSIVPGTATVNVPVSMTVTGENLPLTAVLSLTDATCSMPTNRTAAGFTVVCTPGGTAGSKIAVVSTAVVGGATIDSSRTVIVSASPQCVSPQILQGGVCVTPTALPQVFREDFNGTALSTSFWTSFGVGTVSVANGTMTTSCRGGASTQNKVTFSGNRIVIEGRMGESGSLRDSNFLLVDAVTGEYIQAGDTTYQGNGLYAYGSGSFGVPQTGNGISVAGLQEFRLTLDGVNMKLERGSSLTGPLQTITRTLGSSVNDRTFYLTMGTGNADYCPGTYDWVQITATTVNVTNPLDEDFSTNSLRSEIWNSLPGSGGITLSEGQVTLGANSSANTKGKILVAGRRITIESRMAGRQSTRDTVFGLIDTASLSQVSVGDSNYNAWGLYMIGYGDLSILETDYPVNHGSGVVSAMGGSTSEFMEYRLTLEGDSITVERGVTLTSISQRMVIRLRSSIEGRSFYVNINTGDANYSPGTFDWIRIHVEN